MLTSVEIIFIKELIEQLSEISDISEYTEGEVQEALELLDALLPIETETALDYFKQQKKEERQNEA